MNNKSIRKLCFAGLLVAVAVIGSLLVIPVFGAKCSPVQHMVNVTAAVLLLSLIHIFGVIILRENGDIHRFNASNKLAAFAGLDVRVTQYGEFIGTRQKISKRALFAVGE